MTGADVEAGVDSDDEDEFIGVGEAADLADDGSGPPGVRAGGRAGAGSRELPPLRVRGSLAARIVALVLLVVLGTASSAFIVANQVRGLRANFDLLTGVYVPVQTRLLQAQAQSQRIGTLLTSYGNPENQLERADLLNVEEAFELRANLIAEVRLPLEQALTHPDRLGGIEQLDDVRELDRLLAELEALATLETGGDISEAITDVPRQVEISRRFRELQKLTNETVAGQRDTVSAAGRNAEQRALVVTIAAAVVSLLATLVVILTLRPLRRLAVSVRRIGAGDWRERIEVGERPERDDEVARLAREVNLMAEALEEREHRVLRGERLAAIGRLAAQITHEIRNPLSSVALNAELLEDELVQFGDAAGEARQLLGRIAGEVDRLTQITEAYLGFARRPKPELRRLELAGALTDLLDFLEQEHRRNGIRVVRELASEVWVRADAGQLRQALINLLRNAQEAVLEVTVGREGQTDDLGDLLDGLDGDVDGEPEGAGPDIGGEATITVSLACKDGQALVVVADSGPGIPTPERGGYERIFEAFVTSKTHGTGLGLPMVQQIAVDHGGGVRLLETGPQGTRFEFRLPACDPPAPSVSSPNSA
ncbi:MAG: HAMP domain-containing histidine kinase [Myxococcales bacterium]|nr:HAMP domain-containing histidine kinase [Myxococcales bacterium]